MITARTFVRFAIASLMVNALAVACVVENDGDACDAGETKDCTCPDDFKSEKECKESGNGYGACDCVGHEAGGGGTSNAGGGDGNDQAGDGNIPKAGTGGATGTAGTAGTANNYGGETGGGGAPDTGGVANGGAGGTPGEVLPVECQDPGDDCETCYYGGCCDQWAPCLNDDTCLAEFNDVLACTNEIKATRNVTTADLEDCAQQAGSTNGNWSSAVSELTVNMVDCVAGEPGWEGSPWGNLACKASCFDH